MAATAFADDYGFDASDATLTLQRVLDDPDTSRIVVRDMGTPWIVSKTVFLRSNKTIIFGKGVKVKAKSGTFLDNTQPMFRALNLDNVKLVGRGKDSDRATLQMNKAEYTRSEFGHILGFDGVKNFEIRGLKLTGAGGDGIHVAGATWKTAKPGARTYSENGLITDVIAIDNRRQGLSLDSGKNITVRNSTFAGTSGTAPSAGIDLEPTWDFERLENIKIENVILKDNNGSGLMMALGNLDDRSAPVSIDVNRVKIENNNRSGLQVNLFNSKPSDPYRDQPDGSLPSSMANGTINIRNVDISKSNGTFSPFEQSTAGIYIQSLSGSRQDPKNLKVNFNNVKVSDTGNGKYSTNPIYIRGFGGDTQPSEIGNLAFNNVTIEDRFDRPVMKAELGRPDAKLSNISGNITAKNPKGVTGDFDFETVPENFSLKVNGKRPSGGLESFALGSTPPVNSSPEPIATYGFDDILGNSVEDDSLAGQDNSSTLVNGYKTESMRGRHAAFDEGNGRIIVPNSRDINLGIHPERTISLWFRTDAFTSDKQVIYEEGAGARGLNAYIDKDRLYVGGWNRPESNWQGSWIDTGSVKADQWHHLAIVLDGGQNVAANALTGYLDGQAFGSAEGSQLWGHAGGIGIGGVQGGTRFHDGARARQSHGLAGGIDNVDIYNDALSANQVDALSKL